MVCDIELLLYASQLSYRTFMDANGRPFIDEEEAYRRAKPDEQNSFFYAKPTIEQKGYQVERIVKNSKGSGLNAICLEPTDENTPIVITFRGTKSKKDAMADISIARTGVVGQALRDDAYQLYQETKKKYPGRKIVLAGHSLGGNLAQDVALRAYADGAPQGSVQVRTFNTAPAHTPEGEQLEKTGSEALDNFVNYRLSTDKISDIPGYKGYGDFYSFASGKALWQVKGSHVLSTMKAQLPEEVRQLQVGGPEERLIERAKCMHKAYEGRVNGQLFSSIRRGSANLDAFKDKLPLVAQAINDRDYEQAKSLVSELKAKVKGKQSSQLVANLERDLERLKVDPKDELFKELKDCFSQEGERSGASLAEKASNDDTPTPTN